MGSLGSHVSSLRNGLREADFTISVSANGNSSDPVGAFPHAADVESEIEKLSSARQCVIAFINDVQLSPPAWRDNSRHCLSARSRNTKGTTGGSAISKSLNDLRLAAQCQFIYACWGIVRD